MSYVVTRSVETKGTRTSRELTTVAPTAEEAVAMFRALELAAARDEVTQLLDECAEGDDE